VDENTEIVNEYFSENGFESMILVKNLGSTFLYLLIYLGIVGFYFLVRLFAWRLKFLKTFADKLQGWLFWNASISFMISQFPPLFIAAFINLNDLKFVTTIEKISLVFCILTSLVLPVAFFLTFYILRKYRNDLGSENFKAKYSKLIDGLNTETRIGYYWNPIVLLRWAITNVVLVAIKDSYKIQIFSFLVISVAFQNLINQGQPLETRGENRQALFIEVCNSMYLYIMLMLTDFTGDNPFRELQGWGLAALVSFVVLINIIILLMQIY